jgi:CheY-like chemotaxis protein/nitrogen-specific signal transduction histidine kinase
LERQKAEIEKQNKEYAALNEELRASNEELIAARFKAEESDRLKSAFLTNMSHEIRTPMTAIIGFSDLLNKTNLSKEKQQFFAKTIQKRGYDLLSIIDDILDISKIEAGQMTIFEENGNIEQMMSEIYDTLKIVWSDSGNLVTLTYENELYNDDNFVITDFRRLKQIIINLLNNAFKFSVKGKITFGCRLKDSNKLLFYVSDTGIGIDPENQAIIFERFRQADETTTRVYGGTGLGLSISKGLVELLGGTIWVESQVGKGSTFSFTIPYKPYTKKKKPKFEKNEHTYHWENKKVLLVEDEELSAEYLREVLSETLVQITHVMFGKEALKLFKGKMVYDLVLLDIKLPDIDGYEVARQIKTMCKDQVIIAQTAYASDKHKEQCLEAGCNEYISKPIQITNLLSIMGKYLEE